METPIITEFIQFDALGTTTDEQILNTVRQLSRFQREYEGFLDAEIAKDITNNSWHIIFHYKNFEWVQAIGSHLRSSREFVEFKSQIVSDSLDIAFGQQLEKG